MEHPPPWAVLTQGGTYALMNSWFLLGAAVHSDSICTPNLQGMDWRYGLSVTCRPRMLGGIQGSLPQHLESTTKGCVWFFNSLMSLRATQSPQHFFFFTSFPLADELQKRRMALVGTLRSNKPELPLQLLNVRHSEVLYSVFAFTRNRTAVSYVLKKGKNVLVLRLQEPEVQESGKRKPQIILDYNRCKGAVDHLDQNNNLSKSILLPIIDLVKALITIIIIIYSIFFFENIHILCFLINKTWCFMTKRA